MLGGKPPSVSPSHGTADDMRARDAEIVEQSDEHGDGSLVRIVSGRVRAGQSEAGQIRPDDAEARCEQPCPAVPQVQAHTEAVQQQHGRGIARPLVAQVKDVAGDLAELAGRAGVAAQQRLARQVQAHDAACQQRQHGEEDGEEKRRLSHRCARLYRRAAARGGSGAAGCRRRGVGAGAGSACDRDVAERALPGLVPRRASGGQARPGPAFGAARAARRAAVWHETAPAAG
jgi:hypothetical protein